MKNAKKIKINVHSLRSRIRIVILLLSVLLIATVEITMTRSIRNMAEQAMLSRMEGDINYIKDLIWQADHDRKTYSGNQDKPVAEDGDWSIQDGALFYGTILIGDGTEENAYLEPFQLMKGRTGSFSYTFVRCPDEGLTWAGDGKGGYQQGHYLRVAGSTLDSEGNTIIGTYIDKKVADIIEATGIYCGYANVVGEQVFCMYSPLTDQNGNRVGVIVVGRSVEVIEAQTRKTAGLLFWLIVVSVLLVDIVLNAFATRWIAKLDIANHYLMDISTGAFPRKPLDLHTRDELYVTAQCINEMTDALKEKERISGELEAAANIQRYMLPREFAENEAFGVNAFMYPAKEVGGDFYDFFMTDEDHLAVVIADVSGKGVPAAMFMAIAKMLIKNHAQMGLKPCEVFNRANALLCEGNETSIFVTAWMGVLDLRSGKLTYVNAGHNPPLIRLKDGGFDWLKSKPGMVLAAFDTVKYEQNELIMSPGDRLFLYTDGVTEAMDAENSLYGSKRLKDHLDVHGAEAPAQVLNGLKADIDSFAGGQEQFDDITMLMLDYREKAGKGGKCETAEREFPAAEAALQDAIGFAEETLAARQIPARILSRMLMAVEEIFTNIAKFAYPGGEGTVSLGICTEDKTVRMRFTDQGVPFDPTQAEDPDIDLPLEQRETGGLGIYLVKEIMDEVTYSRENGRNILQMTRKY